MRGVTLWLAVGVAVSGACGSLAARWIFRRTDQGELGRLQAQRRAVLALHTRTPSATIDETRTGGTKRATAWRCDTCNVVWPCPTARALDAGRYTGSVGIGGGGF